MGFSIKSFGRLASARRSRWLAISLSAALLAAASVPSLASAHVSLVYQISGVELPSTSTTANFAGSAVGENLEQAAWSASVQHTILNSDGQGQITGGSFSLLIFHVPETVSGDVVAGGTIQRTAQAPGCGWQTYAVTGTLANVTSSTGDLTSNGAFQATLTHYRTRIGRLCVTYSATIVGQVQLNL